MKKGVTYIVKIIVVCVILAILVAIIALQIGTENIGKISNFFTNNLMNKV